MTAVLVTGIGELTTQDPAVGTLTDAAVVVDTGRVAWVGPSAHAPTPGRMWSNSRRGARSWRA